MGKVDKDTAAKVGDFLFRYMRARHRFKELVERPLPSSDLATLGGCKSRQVARQLSADACRMVNRRNRLR